MPTTLDTQLRPLIKSLIAQFGRPVVIEKKQAVHNPTTNTTTTNRSYQETKGVLEQVKLLQIGLRQSASGAERATLIQEGDVTVMVAAEGLSFTPSSENRLYFGTVATLGGLTAMQIVAIESIYTGEQVGAYMLIVRGKPE
jgi:hypothetical protein